jgi:hypothetical protein
MRRRWPLLLLMALGCASTCAGSARDEFIFANARTWVFERPMDEVYQRLRELVAESGYDMPADGKPAVATVFSSWNGKIRSLVRFIPLSANRFRVQLQYNLKSTGSDGHETVSTDDDEHLLWKLIQRAEPERAARIEAEAQRRGDAAYRSQAGCEAGCRGAGRGCLWVADHVPVKDEAQH